MEVKEHSDNVITHHGVSGQLCWPLVTQINLKNENATELLLCKSLIFLDYYAMSEYRVERKNLEWVTHSYGFNFKTFRMKKRGFSGKVLALHVCDPGLNSAYHKISASNHFSSPETINIISSVYVYMLELCHAHLSIVTIFI